MAIRIGHLKDSTMMAKRLAACGMLVCAAPSYLQEHGTPKTIADLKHHNCLGYTLSRRAGVGEWTFGDAGKGRVAVSGNLRANNGDALVAAAIAGQGIVYQPTFLVAQDIASGHLQALELDYHPIELDGIFAVYPSDRRPPAKVRATIDFLLEEWGRDPPWESCMV